VAAASRFSISAMVVQDKPRLRPADVVTT